MTRWKAASIHLAISFAVLATIAGILLWRWYPPSLLELAPDEAARASAATWADLTA